MSCASPNCLLSVIDDVPSLVSDTCLMRHTDRASDQTVFEQGDPAHGWFWLCEGRIRLTRRTPTGQRQILRDLCSEQIFGIEALNQELVYDQSAVAIEESRLVSIPTHGLPVEILREPRLMTAISSSIICHTEDLRQRLKAVLAKETRTRLVSTLVGLSRKISTISDESYEVSVTNDELAAMVGTTPQTVSRCLAQLQDRGFIERRRGAIEVRHWNALAGLTN